MAIKNNVKFCEMDEFTNLNDAKFDESDIITCHEETRDVRISLLYRLFDSEESNFPEQTYYQLNNCWEEAGQ